jgi:plastocyanin
MKTFSILAAALGAAGILAFAGPASGTSTAVTIKVTATELRFKLVPKAAKPGSIVFQVMNKGAAVHDFKINGKKTPKLKPGKSARLSVRFQKAGRYPYLCTVPGHAAAGMKGVLVVK